jgi:amino acid transporter
MERFDNEQGAPLLQRTADYVPPKSLQTWLFGRPLQTADAPHQTIGKAIGLAVFASDALSSTAYATQEILMILAIAGTAAFGYVFPISLAIVTLLAIVTISYEQTIHAYPGGGGAYIVSRDNLGEIPALVAGAALLMDYILTVSVSIASGVAQLVSAFPDLYEWRVLLAIVFVLFIMVINLRGVKESGAAFAIPTYFFVVMMFVTVATGLFRFFTNSLGMVVDPPELAHLHDAAAGAAAITPFLLLHAFSNGTTALTGVEAISNGITAFKEPRSRNAGITLIWMSLILGSLFVGISFLAGNIGAIPSEFETVISQLARTAFGGRNFLYIAAIGATTVILIMAANTAFADFPRLGALVAADGYLPRQLTYRGSRLVFSYGIVILSIIAIILISIFQANVSRLIPLYAIGVFMSFTLSQSGMALRWWKSGKLSPGKELREAGSVLHYDKHWLTKMLINGFGAICTLVVMFIFAITKFLDGAWIILLVIPSVFFIFLGIKKHYQRIAQKLSLENYGAPQRVGRHRVILPVSGVHRGSLAALRYALALSDDVTAVHVSMDEQDALKLKAKWDVWGEGVRLVILDSPYRLMMEPLLEYVEEILAKRQPNDTLTIVVPQFVSKHWYTNILHTNAALFLSLALLFKPGVVITNVPYQVE